MLIEEIKLVVGQSDKRDWRKFGFTMAVAFGLVAAYLYWKTIGGVTVAGGAALALAVLGLLAPVALKPIFYAWMAFAAVMGFVMTRVILTLLYSIVFTPVGLVLRVLRKDPLSEKMDHSAKSYWIPRERTTYDPVETEKQY